ncbi:CIC11C00000004388 [Sungouiella intermedia]|uniref:CIC11C00000004388 n=1 Tax=Sungouiella intermedia TaxID=45354 RepID=A0A1L0C366_9ASCO|nr:CIC11C00000004388 [[Candida] intermedia]
MVVIGNIESSHAWQPGSVQQQNYKKLIIVKLLQQYAMDDSFTLNILDSLQRMDSWKALLNDDTLPGLHNRG